jgi:WD40 repeat protein
MMSDTGQYQVWEEGAPDLGWAQPFPDVLSSPSDAVITPAGEIRAVDPSAAVYAVVDGAFSLRVPGIPDVSLISSALSGDGRILARSTGEAVQVIDVDTNRTVFEFTQPHITTLDFLNSTTLLVGDPNGTVTYRSAVDGSPLKGVTAGSGRITTLAASDSIIASGGLDGDVVLNSTSSNERVGTIVLPPLDEPRITGRRQPPSALGISPDGSTLVTATSGGELLTWDLAESGLLHTVCDSVGRDLTSTEWSEATGSSEPVDLRCDR